MIKKFVDGSNENPPYFAVLGRDYEETNISYATWKSLEAAKTGGSHEIFGYTGRIWWVRDQKLVARIARRFKSKGVVVTHDELAA